MTFNKLKDCGNVLKFIQIDSQFWKKMDTTVFDLSSNCDLEWRSNLSRMIQLSGPYHHTKFERNQFVNVWVQANDIDFLWMKSVVFSPLNIELMS